MGQRFGNKNEELPVTESISSRLLRLPFYNEMTEEEQTQVIDAITAFRV
jgi:dTDP-4-amino-4,6-dideoxygalactose transaminase